MISRLILLSIFTVSTAFMMLAENADSCVQSQRTQEQFQQEFNEFIKNTRAYMLAKEIIPIDSVHLLNQSQKFTLKYAKNPDNIFGDDNTVYLPLEVNQIIGDTINTKLVSVAQWKDAYFIKNEDYRAMLIIPLEAESKIGKIQSEIQMNYDFNGHMHAVVLTAFFVNSDSLSENILIRSNYLGKFLSAVVYNNDKIIAEIDTKYKNAHVIDYLGNYPKENRKENSYNKISQVSFKNVKTGRQYINERNQQERNQGMNALMKYEFSSRDRSNTK